MLTRDFKTQLQINLNASASVTAGKSIHIITWGGLCVFRSRAPSGNCAGGGTLTTDSKTAETTRPGASMQILNF